MTSDLPASARPEQRNDDTAVFAIAAFEEDMQLSWRMIDPFNPAGAPGSYARGVDAGIVSALQTVRNNFQLVMRSGKVRAGGAVVMVHKSGTAADSAGTNDKEES